MNIQSFLKVHFKGLVLKPSLFYCWRNSLRFEISDSTQTHEHPENQKRIRERCGALFTALFDRDDEVMLVTDVYSASTRLKQPLNVYRKCIRDKSVLYRLSHQVLPGLYNEEETFTHRFSLQCRVSELKYLQLLMSISHEDFLHPSRILKNASLAYDIYFLNVSKNIIFHLYDDRGCDILAADEESLQFVYERYNKWILEFDREAIESRFKTKTSKSMEVQS